MGTLRAYYYLAKPGIVYANTLMALSGYLLAVKWHVVWRLLIKLVFGTALIIAGSCVLNNYLDKGIDGKMKRTRARALVTKQISVLAALIYSATLLVVGFILLAGVSRLVLILGALASFCYVIVYGIAKRYTPYSTLFGTAPGAASLVAGYVAAAHRLDFEALILFLIMLSWQMAHFYAIGVYRYKDYKAANLPIWPVVKGIRSAKQQINGFIILFCLSLITLTASGHDGYIFLIVMLGVGLNWLRLARRGEGLVKDSDNEAWGKSVFLFSLAVITALAVALPVGRLIP